MARYPRNVFVRVYFDWLTQGEAGGFPNQTHSDSWWCIVVA